MALEVDDAERVDLATGDVRDLLDVLTFRPADA